MSRIYHHGERRIKVHGIQREQPDLRRVARAVVELAQLRAEAEAEAQHNRPTARRRQPTTRKPESDPGRGGNA